MTQFSVKPSSKTNWRYVAFKILSEKPVSQDDTTRAIISSMLHSFGESGAADTNLWVLEYSYPTGFLRCSHKSQQQVIAALTLITKIAEQRAAVLVLGVSGTIKRMNKKYLK